MKKMLMATILLACSGLCWSGNLVTQARIVQIGNSPDGSDAFYIVTSGGSGPCAGSIIKFTVGPSTLTTDRAYHIYVRAYAAALAAFSSGKLVSVEDQNGTICFEAEVISAFE